MPQAAAPRVDLPRDRRRRIPWLAFVTLATAAATTPPASVRAQAAGGSYTVTHSALAPGAASSGGTYGVRSSIEPLAGVASGGSYQVASGIARASAAPSDGVFGNGFE